MESTKFNKSIKEKLHLLKTTVEYYSEDVTRRCYKRGKGCQYSPETIGHKNSDGCAIGRLLDPKLKQTLDIYIMQP